jgi:nitroreductase
MKEVLTMDFWQVIEERHSVRNFEAGRDVPPEVVQRILGAAIRAPSAGNCQPWHFVVVRSEWTKNLLAEAAYGQWFIAEAAVVIIVCADPARSARRYRSRGVQLYCLQDTAAAAEHILLAVTALGLGACWVGAFDEGAASQALDLPGDLRPVAIVPIGYPAARPSRTSRRSLEEVVTFGE